MYDAKSDLTFSSCSDVAGSKDKKSSFYKALLQSQVLGLKMPKLMQGQDENDIGSPLSPMENKVNILKFRKEKQSKEEMSPYNKSPIFSIEEEGFLGYVKQYRPLPKGPFKVLDAPGLNDDFYLNLVDWSPSNQLAVGLSSVLYLWSATTGKVSKLHDLGSGDIYTSVAWISGGEGLAAATSMGVVQIWDPAKEQLIRAVTSHECRIGALAWNEHKKILSSGSRDRKIYHYDFRNKSFVGKSGGHKQEVCGLKWSHDGEQLASGGNDNRLLIWNASAVKKPVYKIDKHKAAVKALAWCPWQQGVLASGGGTADAHIHLWNSLTGTNIRSVDTGSQVCNLYFSENVNELLSTHGYSKNELTLWKYPTMKKMASLTGHTCRVIYLAVSPDGQTVVTGAGDETLRFWKLFPPKKDKEQTFSSVLPSFSEMR